MGEVLDFLGQKGGAKRLTVKKLLLLRFIKLGLVVRGLPTVVFEISAMLISLIISIGVSRQPEVLSNAVLELSPEPKHEEIVRLANRRGVDSVRKRIEGELRRSTTNRLTSIRLRVSKRLVIVSHSDDVGPKIGSDNSSISVWHRL